MNITLEKLKPQQKLIANALIFASVRPNTKKWLKLRTAGLGGSDIGKICGLSSWGSPLSVWMEKTGRETSETDSEVAEWGHRLETSIANKFKSEFKKECPDLKVVKKNMIFQSKEYPFMLANADRLIVNQNDELVAGLEIKTAHEFKKLDIDNDVIPDEHMLQCQHYMAVMDVNTWYIAYLVGGNKYYGKRIERDNELIADMIKIEKDFWDKVVNNEMPEPSWQDNQIVNKLFADKPVNEIPLELGSNEVIFAEYNAVSDQLKELEKKKDELRNRIVVLMRNHETAYTDSYKITFKASNYFNEDEVKTRYPELFNKYQAPVFDKETFKKENGAIYKECSLPGSKRLSIGENKETVQLKKGA